MGKVGYDQKGIQEKPLSKDLQERGEEVMWVAEEQAKLRVQPVQRS